VLPMCYVPPTNVVLPLRVAFAGDLIRSFFDRDPIYTFEIDHSKPTRL
jgi:hypothetical protein